MSLVDLACNKGAAARQRAAAGWRVLAADNDIGCIDSLLSDDQLDPQITPCLFDVVHPSGPTGPGLVFEGADDRLRGDALTALALSHHLARVHQLPFSVQSRALWQLARRYLLVEFVDPRDSHVNAWTSGGWTLPSWYCREAFVGSFGESAVLHDSWTCSDAGLRRELFLFERVPE
jgi:hypothetical protein